MNIVPRSDPEAIARTINAFSPTQRAYEERRAARKGVDLAAHLAAKSGLAALATAVDGLIRHRQAQEKLVVPTRSRYVVTDPKAFMTAQKRIDELEKTIRRSLADARGGGRKHPFPKTAKNEPTEQESTVIDRDMKKPPRHPRPKATVQPHAADPRLAAETDGPARVAKVWRFPPSTSPVAFRHSSSTTGTTRSICAGKLSLIDPALPAERRLRPDPFEVDNKVCRSEG